MQRQQQKAHTVDLVDKSVQEAKISKKEFK